MSWNKAKRKSIFHLNRISKHASNNKTRAKEEKINTSENPQILSREFLKKKKIQRVIIPKTEIRKRHMLKNGLLKVEEHDMGKLETNNLEFFVTCNNVVPIHIYAFTLRGRRKNK